MNSWQLHQRLEQTSPFRELAWEAVGPRKQGGRIEAIAVPPRDAPGQMNTMYVGVGSGGLWKTVNNGTTWRPIFQGEATAAIGDVAVAGSNPDHVWVGTGEVLMTPRSTIPGIGVFKSIDDFEKTCRSIPLKFLTLLYRYVKRILTKYELN